MTGLDKICSDLLKEVAAARGVVIIHLKTGDLMAAAYNTSHFDPNYVDTLVEATIDMFQGETVRDANTQLSAKRGKEVDNIIHELQIATGDTCYFMAVIPEKPENVLVLVTGRKTNLGVGWAAVQNALPQVTPFCP